MVALLGKLGFNLVEQLFRDILKGRGRDAVLRQNVLYCAEVAEGFHKLALHVLVRCDRRQGERLRVCADRLLVCRVLLVEPRELDDEERGIAVVGISLDCTR